MAMTLNNILARVGVTIAKTERPAANRVVVLLRVGKQNYWNETLNEFLLASTDPRVSWTTDVSKWFYAADGGVRFLWRVVLNGDPQGAGEALGRAAMRATQGTVEVTSQPLVGRRNYTLDVANGKMMGAHTPGTAAQALAAAVSVKG